MYFRKLKKENLSYPFGPSPWARPARTRSAPAAAGAAAHGRRRPRAGSPALAPHQRGKLSLRVRPSAPSSPARRHLPASRPAQKPLAPPPSRCAALRQKLSAALRNPASSKHSRDHAASPPSLARATQAHSAFFSKAPAFFL
jgi:hypothetical protein